MDPNFRDDAFYNEPFGDDPFRADPFSNYAFSYEDLRADPFRFEALKDEAFSNYVRLICLHEKGECLPRLSSDSKTHEPLPIPGMDLKYKILAAFVKALDSMYGKDGSAL
jgi:hypothetical protein